jgi:hypothetical protein
LVRKTNRILDDIIVCISSPNSTDRVILCRGEQKAILSCLRDIFTQIEKLPPRGPNHPYDPSCYAENQIQRYGGFAHDDSSVYGDRRARGGGGGGNGGGGGGGSGGFNNNYENWEMNNMRGGGGGMYNDDYGGPPNQGFYPPPPPPPPHPQMMGGGGGGGGGLSPGPGPMRPLINSYEQPPGAQTQQV